MHMLHFLKLFNTFCIFCSFFALLYSLGWDVSIDISSNSLIVFILFPDSWWSYQRHSSFLLQCFYFYHEFFLKIFFFLMWTIFKICIKFATILLRFMFWFFGREACGILAPQPGIEPAPPALQGKVLTTGPSGKSHLPFLFDSFLALLTLPFFSCLLSFFTLESLEY